jgi:hypothetical protein
MKRKIERVLMNAVTEATAVTFQLDAEWDGFAIQVDGDGDNTARTVSFYDTLADNTDYILCAGVKTSDLATIESSTTEKGVKYEFAVGNSKWFKVDLSAITGGTVTIRMSATQGV